MPPIDKLRAHRRGMTNFHEDPTMKPVQISVAAIMLALLAAAPGCVKVQSRQYIGVEAFPPTQPDSVEILRTAPTKPHVRLGEITVEPQPSTKVATIEEKFRAAGAKMGANAVVIVSDRTELMGVTETGPWYAGGEMREITGRVVVGVAIHYTTPGSDGLGQVRADEQDDGNAAATVTSPDATDPGATETGGG